MCFGAKRIWGLILVLLLPVCGGHAQEVQPSEYQIKAAFLFNFAKFVEWPTNAFPEETSPLTIGVLGKNPFENKLDEIRGKTINKHPIVVAEISSLAEAKRCHILFISPSEKPRLTEHFKELRGPGILTVGETDGFIEAGGMINFVWEGNKVRFQINDDAAKAAGLKISSKLLSLARPLR